MDARVWHTCAVVDDGSLDCWGRDDDAQLDAPTLDAGLEWVQVSAGGYLGGTRTDEASSHSRTCGLVIDGSVRCWGDTSLDLAAVPAAGVGLHYTSVSVGGAHVCATRSDGQLVCWGDPSVVNSAQELVRDGAAPAADCVHPQHRQRDRPAVHWGDRFAWGAAVALGVSGGVAYLRHDWRGGVLLGQPGVVRRFREGPSSSPKRSVQRAPLGPARQRTPCFCGLLAHLLGVRHRRSAQSDLHRRQRLGSGPLEEENPRLTYAGRGIAGFGPVRNLVSAGVICV